MITINETGIKILNIKAGTLYGFNLGIRDRYDYTTGVLNHSLFRIFLQNHGMKLYKDRLTRDIICLDFDFGSRSYEEEIKHLGSLLAREANEEGRAKLRQIIEKVNQNKHKYCKKVRMRYGSFLQGRRIRHLYRQGQAGKYYRGGTHPLQDALPEQRKSQAGTGHVYQRNAV